MTDTPQPNEIWIHHSGRIYKVLHITNTTHPSEKYPVTVVYQNTKNNTVWSRLLSDWHRSFTRNTGCPHCGYRHSPDGICI